MWRTRASAPKAKMKAPSAKCWRKWPHNARPNVSDAHQRQSPIGEASPLNSNDMLAERNRMRLAHNQYRLA